MKMARPFEFQNADSVNGKPRDDRLTNHRYDGDYYRVDYTPPEVSLDKCFIVVFRMSQR